MQTAKELHTTLSEELAAVLGTELTSDEYVTESDVKEAVYVLMPVIAL